MELYFKEYRDRDFFDVCEKIRKESGTYISCSEIARRAVYMEAQSFYLSEQEYARIDWKTQLSPECNISRSEIKNEMYREIRNRFMTEKRKNPGLNHLQIAGIISGQTAPRFYMSEGRAVGLYYELLAKLK